MAHSEKLSDSLIGCVLNIGRSSKIVAAHSTLLGWVHVNKRWPSRRALDYFSVESTNRIIPKSVAIADWSGTAYVMCSKMA